MKKITLLALIMLVASGSSLLFMNSYSESMCFGTFSMPPFPECYQWAAALHNWPTDTGNEFEHDLGASP